MSTIKTKKAKNEKMENKESKLEKVTEQTLLGEVINDERIIPILKKYNFPCVSCPLAQYELEKLKVIDIAKFYGINAEEVIKEINAYLGEKNEEKKKS